MNRFVEILQQDVVEWEKLPLSLMLSGGESQPSAIEMTNCHSPTLNITGNSPASGGR